MEMRTLGIILSDFELDIGHRAGIEHHAADVLSKLKTNGIDQSRSEMKFQYFASSPPSRQKKEKRKLCKWNITTYLVIVKVLQYL